MDTRVHFILNGRQDLNNVISNLKILFTSKDDIFVLTHHDKDYVYNTVKSKLGFSDAKMNKNVSINCENDDIKIKHITFIQLNTSQNKKISECFNHGITFIKSHYDAQFIHIFADDVKHTGGVYTPELYEWYMNTFDCPFVMDSKTNTNNYIFNKYSPRFIILSKKVLTQPLSFALFESKEHFVIDITKNNELFDTNLSRLYMFEYVSRIKDKKLTKHVSFYPDPVYEKVFIRDEQMPHININAVSNIENEYIADNAYLLNTLKFTHNMEHSVDSLTKEFAEGIERLKNEHN